jgi:hypothetical protein
MKFRTASALAVSALLVVTLAACGGDDSADDAAATPSPSTSATATEACGNSSFGELQLRRFCGEGSITVISGESSLELDEAECETTDEYLNVNAGIFVIAPSAIGQNEVRQFGAARPFASVTAGRYPDGPKAKPASADGTYDAVITFRDGTEDNLRTTDARATLREDRTAGDFRGTLEDGTKVRGSFTC